MSESAWIGRRRSTDNAGVENDIMSVDTTMMILESSQSDRVYARLDQFADVAEDRQQHRGRVVSVQIGQAGQ